MVLSSALVGGLAIAGCDESTMYFHPVDAGTDAALDAGSSGQCSDVGGVCLPVPPPGYFAFHGVLLWVGPYNDAPPCPANAPSATEFYADPLAINTCPFCSCGEPSCVLPTAMSASDGTTTCQGPAFTSFAAHPDGSCSDNNGNPIQANDAQSVSLLAPTVSPCQPKEEIAKDASGSWAKKGIVCSGEAMGTCPSPQECVPKAPTTPAGFMQCVKNDTIGREDTTCPSDYPQSFLLYEKPDYTKGCTPCACDPPTGTICTAMVTVYTDPSCVAGSGFESNTVPLGLPQCNMVPANYPIRGMTAQWVANQPGKCDPSASGGQPTGTLDVDHSTAHQYCCRSP